MQTIIEEYPEVARVANDHLAECEIRDALEKGVQRLYTVFMDYNDGQTVMEGLTLNDVVVIVETLDNLGAWCCTIESEFQHVTK